MSKLNVPNLPEGYFFQFGETEGRIFLRDSNFVPVAGVCLYQEGKRKFANPVMQFLFGDEDIRFASRNVDLDRDKVERAMVMLAAELQAALKQREFTTEYQGKKLR